MIVLFSCTKKEMGSYVYAGEIASKKEDTAADSMYAARLEELSELNEEVTDSICKLQERLARAVLLHDRYNIVGGAMKGGVKFGVNELVNSMQPSREDSFYGLWRQCSPIVKNFLTKLAVDWGTEPLKGRLGDNGAVEELQRISEEAQSAIDLLQEEMAKLVELQETTAALSVSNRQALKDAQQTVSGNIEELEEIVRIAEEKKSEGSSETAKDNTEFILWGTKKLYKVYNVAQRLLSRAPAV